MRKKNLLSWFFLIIFISFFYLFTPRVNAINLLVNPSFEVDDESWKINNSNVSFYFITEEAFDGSRSAKIINSRSYSYGVEQTIKNIDSSLTYQLTGYIKLVPPYPDKAFFRLAWYESSDASGNQIATDDSSYATASSDWQKIEIIKSPLQQAQSVKIRLLVASGSAYFDNILFEQYTPTSTPTPSITPTISPTSYDNIYLSEAMVYPERGGKEWVEIYNNNDFPVFLNNWYIDDIENAGSSPKIFSLEIAPKSYGVVELSTAMFNNSGDSVRLLDFNKILKDSFEYQNAVEGKSYGRISFEVDDFCLQEPSKGFANNSCLNPTNTPTPTLKNTPTPPKTSTPTKTPTPTKTIIINNFKKRPQRGVSTNNKIYQSPTQVLGVQEESGFKKYLVNKKSTAYVNSLITSSFSLSFLNIFYIVYKIIRKLNYHEKV